MTLSVIAAYENFYIANGAVRELIEYGFPRENIRMYTRQRDGSTGSEPVDYMEIMEDTALVQSAKLPGAGTVGAQIGAGIGASIGIAAGLLSLFGLLTIPSIEGLAAPAASTAALTVTGAILGELLGSMIGFGIPMEEAERYAESLRQSDVVVKIDAEPYTTGLVTDVLSRYRPHHMDQRVVEQARKGSGRWNTLAQRLQPATARIFRR